MSKSRKKYNTSFKAMVTKEYFEGASAKELEAKYGVKERTIYSWSKNARNNFIFTHVVGNDNTSNTDIYKRLSELEERVAILEKN